MNETENNQNAEQKVEQSQPAEVTMPVEKIQSAENVQTAEDTQSDRAQSENDTNVSKGKHGLLFYVKVISVFCLCMLLAVGIAIYYFLNKLTSDGNFEKLVNQKATEALNMPISFEKIGISFPAVELTNIHIATDTADMKLDSYIASVKVRPDIFAALRGKIMVDYLTVSSSTTQLEMKAIKSADTAKEQPAATTSSFDLNSISFPFKSLELNDIRLNYSDRGTKANYDVKLNKAGITYSLMSSALPFEIDVELTNLASLKTTGDLYWPQRVLADANLKAINMDEIKKLIPAEYQSYLKTVTGSNIRASVDYSLTKNSLVVKSYDAVLEPMVKVRGNANLPSLSPLNLQASATVSPIKVADVWPVVKGFVPAEYGLSLGGGTIGADAGVIIDGNKPMQIYAVAEPEEIDITTSYVGEKVILKKGLISYDGNNVAVSGFEASLGKSDIKLSDLKIALNDLGISGAYNVNVNIENLLKCLNKYLTDNLKAFTIVGNASLDGKIKGKLSAIETIKLDGKLTSKVVDLTENKTRAKGKVENLNVGFSELGKECGTIKLESLKASATGASVSASGVIKNNLDMGFDCKAAGNLNVDEFSRLAAGLFDLPVKPGQYTGAIDVDLKLGGTLNNLKPSGKVVAKNVYADVSDYGIVVSKVNGEVNADTDKLVLNKLTAELLGGNVEISGNIKDFNNMKIDATASVKNTDLAAIRKMLGKWVPDMPADLLFTGKANLNASLKGSTSAPAISGSAALMDVRFEHPAVLRPIDKINGNITFNNDGLNTNGLTAFWGTSKAKVTGSIKDWAKFITDFKFNVSPLDITDAAGFFLKDSGYEVIGVGSGNGTVTGALEKIKVDCLASVGIGTVTAIITEGGDKMVFPYKKLSARAIYCDSVLDVATASLKLFEGDIAAKAKVYLATEPINFDVDAKLNGVQTQEFLKVNADKKYHNTLVGGINGSAKLTGDTTGLAALNGTAALAMPKGTYDSPDLIKKIAEKVKSPSLASGTIENLAGDYEIQNGRVSSNNTMGKSKDSKVVYRGSIGLDTTLDGNLDFELGPKTCSTGYLKELLGNSEMLSMSVGVKGSLTSPSIDLNVDELAKKAAKNELKKVIDKNISNDKLKEGINKITDKIGDKLGNNVNKLGNSLKKLFK